MMSLSADGLIAERKAMSSDVDVVIVGAGHNGLVAAAYLAGAGLRVEVFERRPFAGGAAITEELWTGFRFSTCAHMVHAVHPKIVRDLRLFERGLRMCTARPGSRCAATASTSVPATSIRPGTSHSRVG